MLNKNQENELRKKAIIKCQQMLEEITYLKNQLAKDKQDVEKIIKEADNVIVNISIELCGEEALKFFSDPI